MCDCVNAVDVWTKFNQNVYLTVHVYQKKNITVKHKYTLFNYFEPHLRLIAGAGLVYFKILLLWRFAIKGLKKADMSIFLS